MALGSDESAVLEIEIDTKAFDELEKKVDKTSNSIAKKFEFASNRASKAFRQQNKEAEAAAKAAEKAARSGYEQFAKVTAAIALGTVAMRSYWDLISKGSGDGARSIQRLEGAWGRLSKAVGEQQASVWKPMAELLTNILDSTTNNQGAVTGLGHAYASAINPAIGFASAVAALNTELRRTPRQIPAWLRETGGPGAAEIQNTMRQRERRGWAMIAERTESGLQRAAAAERGRPGEEGGANVVMAELEITGRAPRNPGEGGGGGGGGSKRTSMQKALLEYQAQLAVFWQDYQRQTEEMQRQTELSRLATIKAAADAEKEIRLGVLDQTLSEEAAIRDKREQEMARARAQVRNEERERVDALTAATKEYALASMQASTATLLEGGNAVKAFRSGLVALSQMAGQRAIFEAAEAVAALASFNYPGAALHAEAAGIFGGIALGAVAVGKGAFGSNFGRQSNGARTGLGASGGGGFSAPRGGGEGGMGPTNITIVLNAAGEMVDDSAMRRLAGAMREMKRRGYV